MESTASSWAQEKKVKHKQKSKKKKAKDKEHDPETTTARIPDKIHHSPELRSSDGKPDSDVADPQPDNSTAAPTETHAAEWDSLLSRVSEQPRQPAAGKEEPASKKQSVSQAPRLDDKPAGDRSLSLIHI